MTFEMKMPCSVAPNGWQTLLIPPTILIPRLPSTFTRVTICVTHTHTHNAAATIIIHKNQEKKHTHPFNGLFSGTTRVGRYQKGKTNLDFTEARDSEWQWQQLGYMQVCTLLQTDNHASTPPLCFYRPDALPAAQPTASKHWRQWKFSWKMAGKWRCGV